MIPRGCRPAPDPSPLTSDHFAALADARVRARKVFRAASIATAGGWTTAIFAALALVVALLSLFLGAADPASIALGAGMGGIAFNEFRGAALLRRFDVRAPKRLALGQLVFGAMICAYAGWSIAAAFRATPVVETTDPQVAEMLAEMNLDGISRSITVAVYSAVSLMGLVVPGVTALYYQTRARHVRLFLAGTPAWAVQALTV